MKRISIQFKKIIPKPLLNFYHFLWSLLFALITGFPPKKIIVIGITGTKGKSTCAYLTYYLLQKLGIKTALSSSEYFFIGEEKIENKSRMTMPGRGFLQRFLKKAVENNCEVAILEVTSEGLTQYRHALIDFDIVVFLNLHPEHIEAHGSYENYRKAKGKLFKALGKSKTKKYFRGKRIRKTIIVNQDDFEADYYLNFKAEQKITFALESTLAGYNFHLRPEKYKETQKGLEFIFEGKKFFSPLLGKFNLHNILAVFAILKALEIEPAQVLEELKNFKGLPGRMEVIQAKGFKVIIDYAHTPHSIEEVYQEALKLFKPQRMLCLIGSAGGIRDKWKRTVIGEIAAKYCHHIIISNEDPFGEDPVQILRAIESGAKKYLAEFDIEKPVEIIEDRKEAIYRLVDIAEKGDLIVTIGKGNEPTINFGDYSIEWNEKKIFLEALENYSKISTKTS